MQYKIRELREKQKMSQAELSKRANVSRAIISRFRKWRNSNYNDRNTI